MPKKIFISPNGSDNHAGTLEYPFQSLAHVQKVVREDHSLNKQGVVICLIEGTYYLNEPLNFTCEDSGSADAPVTFKAFEEGKVILSGGQKIHLKWESHQDGIFKASVPKSTDFDQLFANGELQHMARYPNFDPTIRPFNGYATDAFSAKRASRWKDPTGGYIHAMHSAHWGGYHYRITGKLPNGNITYEGGWQNNRQMGMHDDHRYVENIFEELDAPGEWYHDKKDNLLYFYPPDHLDIQNATFEVSKLKHLVEFNGTPEQPVQHISLVGLTFRHVARTIMEPYEQLLRSDWSIYRGGAVFFKGAENCTISDCEFDHVGGNAVFVSGYNRDITVRGSHFHHTGGSAVCFVGNNDAVRSPLFERNEHQAYEDIDQGKGPKTKNYPAECTVDDCLIHNIGVVEKQATGVEISMSKNIKIQNCSIYDMSRSGINISEGTFGGHLIEFCDVFDTVKETDDHGSFNAWGRDRFWELEGAPEEKLADLMLLDAERSIIRNSRWRCDYGWDVDLDDGSSNYEIYNNVFLKGGLKLREGFCRHVYNNIAVNSTFHPHVWYKNSQDVVENNLWMSAYRPVMKHWGGEIDRNLFVSENDRQAHTDKGCDKHSLVGDPQFIDPKNGDYRLGETSPLLKSGFKNFPMNNFGVKKSELRSIAKTPIFPCPILDNKDATGQQIIEDWLGAKIGALGGEQFSAFGVKREDGGVHLISVPHGSSASKLGFEEDDLIQRLNGCPIRSIKDLFQNMNDLVKDKVKIRIVRKYKIEMLDFTKEDFISH